MLNLNSSKLTATSIGGPCGCRDIWSSGSHLYHCHPVNHLSVDVRVFATSSNLFSPLSLSSSLIVFCSLSLVFHEQSFFWLYIYTQQYIWNIHSQRSTTTVPKVKFGSIQFFLFSISAQFESDQCVHSVAIFSQSSNHNWMKKSLLKLLFVFVLLQNVNNASNTNIRLSSSFHHYGSLFNINQQSKCTLHYLIIYLQ